MLWNRACLRVGEPGCTVTVPTLAMETAEPEAEGKSSREVDWFPALACMPAWRPGRRMRKPRCRKQQALVVFRLQDKRVGRRPYTCDYKQGIVSFEISSNVFPERARTTGDHPGALFPLKSRFEDRCAGI